MAEHIPGVDAAEVAALEGSADRITLPLLPASVQRAAADVERDLEPGLGAHPAMTGTAPSGGRTASEPKGALEILVEQAVSKEFAGIREDLADLKRWGRHTMHLVMVLAHILRVGEDEIEAAKNKVNAADAAFRKGA